MPNSKTLRALRTIPEEIEGIAAARGRLFEEWWPRARCRLYSVERSNVLNAGS